jgi:hypothetical protein
VTVTTFLSEGLHTMELEAFDGTARSTDEVIIDISSVSPDAGILTVPGNVLPGWVDLKGSATDSLNRPLQYRWTQTSGPMVMIQNETQASARYFAVSRGTRAFSFTAVAGATPALPQTIALTTTNLGPWPGWLPRLVLAPQKPLLLRPQAVDDSNADPVTHAWTSSAGTLRSAVNGDATITASAAGVFPLVHEVDDGQGATASRQTEVVVVGVSKDVFLRVPDTATTVVGTPVLLDASATFTLDGRPVSFQWSLLSGAGRLTNSRSAQANFTPEGTATATLKVVATTAEGGSESREIKVLVNTPTAVAARVPPAKVSDVITLDASRSFDVQASTLAFTWSQLGGSPVSIQQPTMARTTFTALRPGLFRFSIVAANAAIASLPATVDVVVTSGSNRRPSANAGVDQQASPGTEVTLSSSQSSDPDGDRLTAQWQQLSGPPVPIDPGAEVIRLTPQVPGRYRFELVVWDAEVPSEPDLVEVVVARATNQAPVADIEGPASGAVNEALLFSGAGSGDADGDALTFRWTLTGFPTGAKPSLTGDTQPQATLTGDVAGAYTVRLAVSDGTLNAAVERVVIVGSTAPKACGCSDTSGAPALMLAALAMLRLMRRSRP